MIIARLDQFEGNLSLYAYLMVVSMKLFAMEWELFTPQPSRCRFSVITEAGWPVAYLLPRPAA
jgi:hypothetical protein